MNGEADLRVDVLLGLMLASRGPSYTLVRIMQGMEGGGLHSELFAPMDRWTGQPTGIPTTTGGLDPRIDARLPYRWVGSYFARRAEHRLLTTIDRRKDNGIVFTWGEVSLGVSRALKSRGVPVVREKFNCAKRTAKDILDRAYSQMGIAGQQTITDQMIAKEQEELSLADAIFCPSPMVTQSLLDLGFPAERLLPTSYGWEPARFVGIDKALEPVDGPTLMFAGYICVRKGAHLLLEGWRDAKIRGRLVLVGAMEPLIAERYADILAREDVVHLPYTSNIGALYRSADWFVFPTLEEGGPQVTYEAAGNGLPVVVSRMGAGAFARDGVDGLVLDSDQVEPWTELIASLPTRGDERRTFADNARTHAVDFTYEQVGLRRRELLLKRFGKSGSAT